MSLLHPVSNRSHFHGAMVTAHVHKLCASPASLPSIMHTTTNMKIHGDALLQEGWLVQRARVHLTCKWFHMCSFLFRLPHVDA